MFTTKVIPLVHNTECNCTKMLHRSYTRSTINHLTPLYVFAFVDKKNYENVSTFEHYCCFKHCFLFDTLQITNNFFLFSIALCKFALSKLSELIILYTTDITLKYNHYAYHSHIISEVLAKLSSANTNNNIS